MAHELGGDIGVDVLVIGAGIQGLYVARSLSRRYSVCVLHDPAVESETLQSQGYISAGYDGDDVMRVQPARRAAGYWRLWAETHGVAHDHAPALYAVPPQEHVTRPAMWSDATLPFSPAGSLPSIFSGGSLEDHLPYVAESDVVLNPAAVLNALREELEPICVNGTVVRFGLVGDSAVDHVQVEIDDQVVPIVPRFVVLAAGVGNANLLAMIGKRFNDQSRRKDAQELARASQAVRRSYLICIRGRDLPMVNGWFGGLKIATHPLTSSDDVVWLVAPPPDDALTTLGPDDLRFEPKVDPAVVRATLEQLFEISPELQRRAPELHWSCYAARRAQHPMLAATDTSRVAQPVPAKLDAFGLDSLLALWPSHLGYAMVLGDVVVERIQSELGEPADFGDSMCPSDLSTSLPPMRARWDRELFPWRDWASFASRYEIKTE